VYEAAGGSEGLLRLAVAWHERVLADEPLRQGLHDYSSSRVMWTTDSPSRPVRRPAGAGTKVGRWHRASSVVSLIGGVINAWLFLTRS
jgi:hypothetical protein